MNLGGGYDIGDGIVEGYDYQEGDQPVHLEIWCEKSTVDDVLVPLCQVYGMNLVTGTGYESITASVVMLQRALEAGKRVRLLYISDYDPAGRNMPIAVARQLE